MGGAIRPLHDAGSHRAVMALTKPAQTGAGGDHAKLVTPCCGKNLLNSAIASNSVTKVILVFKQG